MFVRWLLIFSSLLAAVPAHAEVLGEHFYVLKKDEVVSEVLRALKFRPIYGPDGNLVKLAFANPNIADLNHVMPEQKIIIPNELVEQALKRKKFTIAASGEIVPNPGVQLVTYDVAKSQDVAPVRAIAEFTPETEAKIANPNEVTKVSPPPTPTKLTPPTREEKVAHTIEFESTYKFSSLNATDKTTQTNAEILTSRDVEAGVSWKQQWHSDARTFGTFAVRNVAFEPTPAGSKLIATAEKSAARFEIGGENDIGERAHVRYSFEYGQQYFVRGYNSMTVVVDAVAVPSIGVIGVYDLLSRDGTTLALRADARYLFSAQGQALAVESGQKFGGGLSIQKQSAGKALTAEFGYYQIQQNTSLTTQNEAGAYGTISFSMPLFGDSP